MLNRVQLFASLHRCITAAVDSGRLLGLLVLRTQRVREFSLLFGYEAGERIAEAMRAAVVAAVRPEDEVLQIGECDFAILLPDVRNRQHVALAAAKLVRVLQAPLDADGHGMQASVAIGAAVCPQDSTDPDLLCRLADNACDAAAASSERFALYTSPEFSDAFAHGDLRDAIAANHLHLFLQPIADLHSGTSTRMESLSRWNHQELGAIPPDAFIRVAEQTGLIGELTRWNLNVTLRHVAAARDSGCPFSVSVNVSARVLQQSFPEQIVDMLAFWGVPSEAVVLEVTESALMDDLARCQRMLRNLRDHGFGIAIDDFGTGYSSMAYLKSLPVTELKIDRSFTADMRHDARAGKLVGSMIDLAHHLDIEVVAEGVEDRETLERLRAMGCDYAQGYYIGRPSPAGDAIATLRAARGEHGIG